uniref:Uncharacterized protein n=1 Tax=Fagus sylvatica TaxID=28930 RepID=A0A2N9EJU8_FAGSY
MRRLGSGLARFQPNNGVRYTLPKGFCLIRLVNNISESINAMILPTKDKPMMPMLEWIRVRLMTRLHTKRIVMEKHGGSVCPNVQDKLEKLKIESRSFSAMPSGYGTSQVSHANMGLQLFIRTVSILRTTIHDYYLKEAYLNVYSEIIHPMPGQDEWIKTGHLPPQPPHVLRPPGRPKKLRRRDPDEPRNPHKPVSVRDSTSRGAGSGVGIGKGATSGVGSGVGRGATYGTNRGSNSGTGRGSTSGAGMGSTSGQASGASRSSISG